MGIACAIAVCGWLAAGSGLGTDYRIDAGPPIAALAAGDVGAYFDASPLLGSFSLLLRAPLAALAGADTLLEYRLGAFALLLGAGLLAVALERLMARRGQPLAARLVAAGLIVVNPVTAEALSFGHPEEFLGAALAVGAVLAATRDRPLAAGLLLGLALATKQWALIAFLPALMAAPAARLRLGAVAIAVAAVLTLPSLVASPSSFATATENAAGFSFNAGDRVTALNVWFPFAEARFIEVPDGVGTALVEKRSLPTGFVGATHIGIVLLALPLSALWWFRRRPGAPGGASAEDALLLLALLLLLRCVLDPWDNQYYHAPFLASLAAWEGLRRRGLPVLTMLVATAMWLSFDQLAPRSGEGITTALYLGWALPAVAWLATELYSPATIRSLGKRVRISGSPSLTITRSSIRTPNAPGR